ncbi:MULTISPECIES: ribosomal protection-like ABC-F family protein [Clostridium]|uniref:ribosomal protection-like ABC-F family protein n=1 Tax=Clostridium TaxID=1485 RepID=UPI00258D9A02|nr:MULTISPECIES: ABC-F type ribosomal protection protein [Clostridium]MDU4846286.1 ABC-F type ribosomal protection protein [Clostridium sp.]CAI3193892.1 ATP-binding cassette, subfamily F, member 3 [Clostridium neonatale]CAI3215624.1 ATP-binding cassette, subfamily F, member 3 [Clostridium neonatale]CAI3705369.1 ATP-binding cassette, subfamily F, member 3 [Clostridium neonatale]
MIELSINKLEKYLDSNKIFDDITLNIYDGEKVGIVGDNGCGKTTLLKIICGIYEMTRDDKGSIFITKNASISYLNQMPSYSQDTTVLDVLNKAFDTVKEAEVKMKELESKMREFKDEKLERALKEYNRLQEFYEAHDGYKQDEKLKRICTGLKINEEFLKKDFKILSGGEKTTVVLGKILIENPDILLLDEPTNHLDMESCEWLEGFLKSYKGMVIIVSHDRYFLDNVVTKIIEIEDKESTIYQGNYSDYTKQKEENMLIEFNQYKEQQKKIEAMENAIKRLRDWASRGDNEKFFKRAASMQKALDKIKRIDKPKMEKTTIKLNFNETERSGNEVLNIKNLSKSYEDKILFDNAELNVRFKERVGVIGKNGCGKTTLLKMILNEEEKYGGDISLGENIKLAYLPQNIEFEYEERSVIDEFRKDISMVEGQARGYLSKFMFYGSDVFKKIRHLSGGERIRLKLSKLLYEDINLLIMDEPTNHLDIGSIETLEEALNNFKGTIIFISHDRYFLNKMSERIVAIENGKFESYLGNYDYYKENKQLTSMEKQSTDESDNPINCGKNSKDMWKNKKDEGRELKKLKSKAERMELNISDLEEKIREIDKSMVECACEYDKLNELDLIKKDLEQELDGMISEWESLVETLEGKCQ